jgi:hypothetical protein
MKNRVPNGGFKQNLPLVYGLPEGICWSGAVLSTEATKDRSSPCEPEAAHLLSAENQPAYDRRLVSN